MTDRDLERRIEDAFDLEPGLDSTGIGIVVDAGVVTLCGDVSSSAASAHAARVALRVAGVKALANGLSVHVPTAPDRTDTSLAHAAVAALDCNSVVPRDRIVVAVANGWLTLNGTVDWPYQRDIAARVVRTLTGVLGVTNDVMVRPQLHTEDIETRIEDAFRRGAELDAAQIHVSEEDGTVILRGNVRSRHERQDAARAARTVEGVSEVDDRLAEANRPPVQALVAAALARRRSGGGS